MTDIVYMGIGQHLKVLGVSTVDLEKLLCRLRSLEELLVHCETVVNDDACVPEAKAGLCNWNNMVALVQKLRWGQ